MPGWLFGQSNSVSADKASQSDSSQLWTLRHVGDSLVEVRQFSQAKQVYEQSLLRAKQTGQSGLIGLSYRAVGTWYESVGDYAQSIVY